MAQGWVDVEDSKLGLREPSCLLLSSFLLLLDPNFGFALLLLRLVRLPGRREQARPPCVSGFEEKILRGDHHRTSHSSWDVNQRHDGSNPFFGGLIFPLSQTALSNIETGDWIKLMLIPISLGHVDLVQGPKVKLLASCEEVLGLGGCSVLLLQQLRRRWTFWFVNNVDLVPLTLDTFGTLGTLGTFGFRIGDEQRSLAIKPQVFGLFPRDRSLVKAVVAQHDEPFDGSRYASDVNFCRKTDRHFVRRDLKRILLCLPWRRFNLLCTVTLPLLLLGGRVFAVFVVVRLTEARSLAVVELDFFTRFLGISPIVAKLGIILHRCHPLAARVSHAYSSG
eukprot:m.55176 g.55176  ORF g.55176 m.55176 type:complete len:336 (-) comp16866_c0_seq1:18-1025(-)